MKIDFKLKEKDTALITIIKLYVISILVFSIFRFVLFVTEIDRVSEDGMSNILKAFIMGVRFDIVISGYLLLLPVIILLVLDILKIRNEATLKSIFIFIFTLFSISFLICAADIPYFNQFFSRFSVTAFEWMDSPAFVFKMIFQEPKYFLFILPALLLIFVYYKVLKKTLYKSKLSTWKLYIKIPIYILILGIMVLGIRGKTTKKSPIRIGTAYFCDNSFLNQLGLNPVFTLMRSYIDSKDEKNKSVHLIDSETAKANVIGYLNIGQQKYASPIARNVVFDSIPQNKPNVVVIIMESMSAAKMKRHGNNKNLTPFLDSLSNKSIYFENIYTAGKHTYSGIFSTIFSFPTIFRQHSMKQMRKYNGMATTLKKHDYQTIYFSTHDGQFDNVEGFLIDNDFTRIVSQKDYPYDEVKTTLGVPDDYMFSFSIPILNELSENKKPFLAVFMTASDHGPYYIPKYYSPQANNIKDQIVQYADWSLKSFIEKSLKQSWFKNTIFVFIADHGAAIKADYDISLDYHHTPLIFYAPSIIDSTYTIGKIGGQIDVFPTIMGFLQLPYLNNSLGIDLLNEDRQYIMINDDDKVGVLDNDFLLIMNQVGKSKLYKYRKHDKNNYIEEYKEKANQMEIYIKSNLQIYQDMMIENKTYIK